MNVVALVKKWVYWIMIVDSSLFEFGHIRVQETRAELECGHAGDDLEMGRVCFCCQVTRFRMLNWAYNCYFCKKNVSFQNWICTCNEISNVIFCSIEMLSLFCSEDYPSWNLVPKSHLIIVINWQRSRQNKSK